MSPATGMQHRASTCARMSLHLLLSMGVTGSSPHGYTARVACGTCCSRPARWQPSLPLKALHSRALSFGENQNSELMRAAICPDGSSRSCVVLVSSHRMLQALFLTAHPQVKQAIAQLLWTSKMVNMSVTVLHFYMFVTRDAADLRAHVAAVHL